MSGFSIERTVGLGIIATLLIQSASAVHWAGAVDMRLMALENNTFANPPITERLARLEAQMDLNLQYVQRIENRLDHNVISQDMAKTQ